MLLVGLVACDSAARVKPWRHAPDPTAEAARAPRSPVLDGPSDAEVHANRDHTLRIHVDAEPGRLTPIASPSLWARRITLGTVFEPLLRVEDGHYAPRLAQSWHVNQTPNGTEIRIVLADNVTFHDGQPLTSSDVQFTLDAIRDPKNHIDQLRPMLDDVFAVELFTSREVNIVLKRPSGWVLRALAEIPILPMHVYQNNLGNPALVGTGPWKLASNKGGTVHLTRYDKYWGKPAAIADLEFVYESDAAAALTQAKRGELDIIPSLIPAHLEQAEAPSITSQFASLELAPPRLRALAFNTAHAPLDDPNVRRALALLVDRRTIAAKVFHNLERPALWPVWPGGLVDGPEAAIPAYDPATAGKLLDAAGWVDTDKDGFRDKNGKPLRLVMLAPEHAAPKDLSGPANSNDREMFVDAARRAGVRVEVRTGNEAKRFDDGNYDLVEVRMAGMTDMDIASLVREHSPSIDRALDAMGAAWEPAERTKLAPELAAALGETWPFAGIVADAPKGLIARRVKGVRIWDGWLDLSQLRLD